MRMKIGPATLGDLSGIQRVARATWADVYEGIIPREVQARALDAWYADDLLAQSIESSSVRSFVAEDESGVIGFIQIVGSELTRIYVLPGEQRRGVGTRLLDAALPATGLIRVEVEHLNARGRRFYERSGFTQVGERPVEVFGWPLLVSVYERRL